MGKRLNSLLTMRATDPAVRSVSPQFVKALILCTTTWPTEQMHAFGNQYALQENQPGQSLACAGFGKDFLIALERAPCLPLEITPDFRA